MPKTSIQRNSICCAGSGHCSRTHKMLLWLQYRRRGRRRQAIAAAAAQRAQQWPSGPSRPQRETGDRGERMGLLLCSVGLPSSIGPTRRHTRRCSPSSFSFRPTSAAARQLTPARLPPPATSDVVGKRREESGVLCSVS